MAKRNQAEVKITANNQLKAGLHDAMDELGKFGKSIEGLGKLTIGAGLGLAIYKVGEAAKACVNNFMETEDTYLRLAKALNSEDYNKAIKSIGKFSKYTKASRDELAHMMSVMASMGKTSEEMDKITEAAISLSNVTGKDLNSSFEIMLDSLNGSTGELEKFLPQVRDMNVEMKASGGAIDEVIKKFGNLSKEVSGNSFSQTVSNIKNSMDSIGESIGGILSNALGPVFTWIENELSEIDHRINAVKALTEDDKKRNKKVSDEPFSGMNKWLSKLVYQVMTGYPNNPLYDENKLQQLSYNELKELKETSERTNDAINARTSTINDIAAGGTIAGLTVALLAATGAIAPAIGGVGAILAGISTLYQGITGPIKVKTGETAQGIFGIDLVKNTKAIDNLTVAFERWQALDEKYSGHEPVDKDWEARLARIIGDYKGPTYNPDMGPSDFYSFNGTNRNPHAPTEEQFKAAFELQKAAEAITENAQASIKQFTTYLKPQLTNQEKIAEIETQLDEFAQQISGLLELGLGDSEEAKQIEIIVNNLLAEVEKIRKSEEEEKLARRKAGFANMSKEEKELYGQSSGWQIDQINQLYDPTINKIKERIASIESIGGQTRDNNSDLNMLYESLSGYEKKKKADIDAIKDDLDPIKAIFTKYGDLSEVYTKAIVNSELDLAINNIGELLETATGENAIYLQDIKKELEEKKEELNKRDPKWTDTGIPQYFEGVGQFFKGMFTDKGWWKEHWENFQNSWKDGWSNFAGFFKGMFTDKKEDGSSGWWKEHASDLWTNIKEGFSSLYNAIADIVKEFDVLGIVMRGFDPSGLSKIVIDSFNEEFQALFDAAIAPLIDGLKWVGTALADSFLPIMEALHPVMENIAQILVTVIEPVLQLLSPFMEMVAGLLELLAPVIALVGKAFEYLTSPIRYLGHIFSWVGGVFKTVAHNISEVISNIFTPWKIRFESMPKWEHDKWVDDAFGQGLTDRVNRWDEIGKRGDDVERSVSTGTAVQNASYQGATHVTLNIYQQAPVVGEGGMMQFALMVKEKLDEAEHYGL